MFDYCGSETAVANLKNVEHCSKDGVSPKKTSFSTKSVLGRAWELLQLKCEASIKLQLDLWQMAYEVPFYAQAVI